MKDVIAFDEMTYQYDEDYKLFLEGIKYSFNAALYAGRSRCTAQRRQQKR